MIVARSLVGVDTMPVAIKNDEMLRNCVDKLLQFALRLLSIVDIRA